MKKKFVTPRVTQEVQICLEKDLLQDSADLTATIEGQDVVEHDGSYFGEQEDDWN